MDNICEAYSYRFPFFVAISSHQSIGAGSSIYLVKILVLDMKEVGTETLRWPQDLMAPVARFEFFPKSGRDPKAKGQGREDGSGMEGGTVALANPYTPQWRLFFSSTGSKGPFLMGDVT